MKQQRETLNALYDTVADKIQALKEKKKKKKQDRAVKEEEKIWYDSVQRGDTDIIQYDNIVDVDRRRDGVVEAHFFRQQAPQPKARNIASVGDSLRGELVCRNYFWPFTLT